MIRLLRTKTTEKLSYDWAIGTLSMVVYVIAKHAMILTLRLVLNHHPGFGSQSPKDSFLVLKNINDSTLILFHQYFEVQMSSLRWRERVGLLIILHFKLFYVCLSKWWVGEHFWCPRSKLSPNESQQKCFLRTFWCRELNLWPFEPRDVTLATKPRRRPFGYLHFLVNRSPYVHGRLFPYSSSSKVSHNV